jgi:3-deoxy-D-manno-octulosonic-acid transferase
VRSSPVLLFYGAATALLGPLAGLWLAARVRGGKEDAARIAERLGRSTQSRPAGRLFWLHAASVGESGVALQLIGALSARDPSLSFLVTTGTRTSAELVARRANARTQHAYVPLDRADAAARFIAHWRPDFGVFVESELWPNLILAAERAGIPLALVNARMSPASLGRWRRWRAASSRLLRAFSFISAADARTGEALAQYSGRHVATLGNLKLAAPPPTADAAARSALKAEIGARPVWLAASTHAGEDEIILAAHARLREHSPSALLIIVPRHPERGQDIAGLAGGAPRRALWQPIGSSPVYVADTLGELGLFYSLAPVALVAGSLLPSLKGHNPVEPAKLGAAILSGPYVESFEDLFGALSSAGGVRTIDSAESLAASVAELWRDEPKRAQLSDAARRVVDQGVHAMDETVDALVALAEQTRSSAHASA